MIAQQALLDAWTRRGWLAWLLWPVSVLYGALAALRRGLYQLNILRTHRLPVPVIIVGNVIAGGAGKTPAVIALVRHLQSRGLRPGVISRGHGRATHDCREAGPRSPASEVGDEPALVARSCGVPVFVASERVQAARALLATYPLTRVIVCDDGLQHYALQRDIEICVFDERGTGNGFLLPAGPLREPWPRPVDLVLHTATPPVFAGYTGERLLAGYAVQADGTRIELARLRRQPVTAVAAIARPESFFAMLREQGLELARTIALPDHHDFAGWLAPGGTGQPVLCTEKDAVKLWHTHPQAWAVPLVFTPEPRLLQALDRLLDAKLSSALASNRNP